MDRQRLFSLALCSVAVAFSGASGCSTSRESQQRTSAIRSASIRREAPVLAAKLTNARLEAETPMLPFGMRNNQPTDFWDLTLEEVVAIALAKSEVIRELGGRVVDSPASSQSAYEVAIKESDPLFGPQAALSAFDAQANARLFWQKNDRVFNNNISGLGVNQFQQDLLGYSAGISKVAATGTQFSLGHQTLYDRNNSTTNLFPSAWDSQVNLSIRQPMLRGAGVEFNRIAGPNGQPGFYFSHGVLLARIDTDVSVADFEAGIIGLLDELETAYWELNFAYRNLDAVGKARDQSRLVLEEITAAVQAGVEKGFRQLAAEIQTHALDEQYDLALNGAARSGEAVGVYRGERQLRWLMGLPTTDGRLIRPTNEPFDAELVFDWQETTHEALNRRVEVRRQQWVVQRRQLELVASKNFILPQLDVFSTYRVRGFGDDLAGGSGNFSSAWQDLSSFNHQEWEAGLDMRMPVGFRQGYAAVRNAKLKVARECAVLKEIEARVVAELSNSTADLSRAYRSVQVNHKRLLTAIAYHSSLELSVDNVQITPESRIDAINQIANAEVQYHRALVDHMLAIKNVHRQKGSLLQLNSVLLDEDSNHSCVAATSFAQLWTTRPNQNALQTGVISGGEVAREVELQAGSNESTEIFGLIE